VTGVAGPDADARRPGPPAAGASSPKRYDLLVFDFDGVLADSFPFFLRVHDDLAREHGFRAIAAGEVEAMRALPTREIVARSGLPLWKLPVVARAFTTAMRAAGDVPMFAGIADVLPALARGATLALVTSNTRANVRQVLGPTLLSLFAHVDCGASMFGKATRLRRLLKATATPPANAIYLGDQVADGDAAREAGIDFGAVDWGYAAPAALAACAPVERFADVADLRRLVAR